MKMTNDLLIVIDMQRDFITGSLGSEAAQAIVPKVAERVRNHQGPVYYTQDTHGADYLTTQEGHYLPVEHCRLGTDGWEVEESIQRALLMKGAQGFEKQGFGSPTMSHSALRLHNADALTSITLCGVCTDICVIANAMFLKSTLPNVPIYVRADLCAGVSPESHETALKAMEACQIAIING